MQTLLWFYNDPLEALWMQRRFGMQFVCKYTEEEKAEFEPAGDFYLLDHAALGEPQMVSDLMRELGTFFRKIYLHPDSVKLLEPQEGDEGYDLVGHQFEFIHSKWCELKHGRYWPIKIDENNHIKIDKRNGIAFMWPEKEEG